MAKILIVDDSPTEIHVYKTMLEESGHQVLSAESAEDGIKMAEAEQPSLILMDVVMPGMNGFQATRHLTRNDSTAHIPVIIVSTKDQETDKVWGLRQGAKDYLVKPIAKNDLIERVSALIG